MTAIAADRELDVRGLVCPMPLVKARQTLDELEPGQVLKVLATDRGSVPDFQGWARTATQIALLAQHTEPGADGKPLYIHYVRRTA
jgi:TusA-related sulfurtransferase